MRLVCKLPVDLEASENPYTKPVYILASQQSGSATEITVMSSQVLPLATRIGAHTIGATSDALAKFLPNDWTFSLSNEIYTDNQGINSENMRLPVDIELDSPLDRQTLFKRVADDLAADKKTIPDAIAKAQN